MNRFILIHSSIVNERMMPVACFEFIMTSGKDDVGVSTVDGKGRRTTLTMQSFVLNKVKKV